MNSRALGYPGLRPLQDVDLSDEKYMEDIIIQQNQIWQENLLTIAGITDSEVTEVNNNSDAEGDSSSLPLGPIIRKRSLEL
jgi:hypothetical protein